MAGNFTLFTNDSGTGAAASDYLKDAFSDFTNPANVNTGLTDSSLTNPMGQFFQNDDLPKYAAKTLWIKDLILLSDRTKWINNKPTYQIIWNEPFVGAYGYVFGNIRLRNQPNGISVDIRSIGDGIAINGVIRKLAWIVNGTTAVAGTARMFTDGSDTSSNISFGGIALDNVTNGYNHFDAQIHTGGTQTKDLHEFRILANEYSTLNVSGIIVYYENSSLNIDCFPGTTYVDKDKNQTTAGVTLPIGAITGKLGGKSVIAKSTSNTYVQTTSSTPFISSAAIGSSGTNLVTVTTGSGASYPVGTGVVGYFGSTFYIGTVSGQSTDTLTVSPTLPFSLGASMILYKSWAAGTTLAIGATLYDLRESLDFYQANNNGNMSGFGKSNTNNFFYSSQNNRFRVWGANLMNGGGEGQPGIQFLGGTTGFIQIEGKFSALEFETAGNAYIHATFSINGQPSFNLFQGSTGIVKRTIMTDGGPSWNIVKISSGVSMGPLAISKINFYDRAKAYGTTLGLLAEYETAVDYVPRVSHSATLMSLGAWNRIYADSLHLEGAWSRGVTTGAAGGVQYIGASTNAILKFQYYGQDFALIGPAGASFLLTLDGSGIGATLNTVKSVPSLGFHTVQATWAGGTTIIQAFDYLGPQVSELKSLQKTKALPVVDNIPAVYVQSDTPKGAKNGDIWAQDNPSQSIWMKLFGRWFKLGVTNASDDPNALGFYRSHGDSVGGSSATSRDMEIFNFVAWGAGPDSPYAIAAYGSCANSAYFGTHNVVDGVDVSGSGQVLFSSFNKTTWSALTPKANYRNYFAMHAFAGYLWNIYGRTAAASTGSQGADRWSGSSWASLNTTGFGAYFVACFSVNNLINAIGGYDGTNQYATHNTRNAADTTSTATDSPATGSGMMGAGSNQTKGLLSNYAASAATSVAYEWDGSSWSSALVTAQSRRGREGSPACGYDSANNLYIDNGGKLDNTTPLNNSQTYIGTSFQSAPSSTNSRAAAYGSVI